MLKYDPAKMVERAKGCLANKKEIIEVADKLSRKGSLTSSSLALAAPSPMPGPFRKR